MTNIEEFRKLKYIDVDNIAGRFVPLMTFKDDKDSDKWKLWFENAEGELQETKIHGLTEGDYVALNNNNDTNSVYLFFYDFIIKHAFFGKTASQLNYLADDFQNICTIVSKFNTYSELSKEDRYSNKLSRYISTEIEYLFILCRSIFDILQEIISSIWDTVEPSDPNISKKQQPKSFKDIILKGNDILSIEDIAEKRKLPRFIIEFYQKHAEFFKLLRNHRDNIVHFGKSGDTIFIMEDGLGPAISENDKVFREFNIQVPESAKYDTGGSYLISFKLVLHFLINNTLNACDDLIRAISTVIKFPPSIIPNHNVYIKGRNTTDLIKLNQDIKNGTFWW